MYIQNFDSPDYTIKEVTIFLSLSLWLDEFYGKC